MWKSTGKSMTINQNKKSFVAVVVKSQYFPYNYTIFCLVMRWIDRVGSDYASAKELPFKGYEMNLWTVSFRIIWFILSH